MTTKTKTTASKLEPPGAGLSPSDLFLAKNILMPLAYMTTSWDAAVAKYEKESEKIEGLMAKMPKAYVNTPTLISPILGIEDSSRNWSALMTVKHLIIVGEGLKRVIEALSMGQPLRLQVKIEDLKPPKDLDEFDTMEAFKHLKTSFVSLVSDPILNRNSEATHEHPWFGPMTNKQWVVLAAIHQELHRKQLQRIIGALPKQ